MVFSPQGAWVCDDVPQKPANSIDLEASSSADPVMQDNDEALVARARKLPPGPAVEELDRHGLTHVVFRSWCRHCVSGRAREDPHRRVATHEGWGPEGGAGLDVFHPRPGARCAVVLVGRLYDTGAVMAMQSTKDSSVETVGAVVQPLETWRHIDVVLHADGEQRASYETVGEGDCERQGA